MEDSSFILIVIVAATLIGLSKGGLGGSLPGLLAMPILQLGMPMSLAVGFALPMLIFADMFAMQAYWGKWQMRHVRLLLPAGIIGVLLGVWLLSALATQDQDRTLRVLVGIFTLIAAIYKVVSDSLRKIEYTPVGWHGYLAGFASGFGSALANAGGPPLTAYLLLQKLEPVHFVGTTTLYFTIINLLKVPGYLQAGILNLEQLLRVAWALPIIVLGVFAGRWLTVRINRVMFERVILICLFGAGLYLIFG